MNRTHAGRPIPRVGSITAESIGPMMSRQCSSQQIFLCRGLAQGARMFMMRYRVPGGNGRSVGENFDELRSPPRAVSST